MSVRLIPCGLHAVLAEYASLNEVIAAADAVRYADLPGVREVVPGARTVLVQFEGHEPDALRSLLTAQLMPAARQGALVEIPVRYDGIDLVEVAAAVRMRPHDVVALHSETTYTAAFCGFAPGFAYLSGLPAILHLPRRSSPRTLVPAGTLAMASEFTGVYPTASPGGWHLLGSVEIAMFDVDRVPPALIAPGDSVRFLPR